MGVQVDMANVHVKSQQAPHAKYRFLAHSAPKKYVMDHPISWREFWIMFVWGNANDQEGRCADLDQTLGAFLSAYLSVTRRLISYLGCRVNFARVA